MCVFFEIRTPHGRALTPTSRRGFARNPQWPLKLPSSRAPAQPQRALVVLVTEQLQDLERLAAWRQQLADLLVLRVRHLVHALQPARCADRSAQEYECAGRSPGSGRSLFLHPPQMSELRFFSRMHKTVYNRRTRGGNKETCLFPPKQIMGNPKTQYKILRHLRWMQEQTSVRRGDEIANRESPAALQSELGDQQRLCGAEQAAVHGGEQQVRDVLVAC